MTSTCSTVRREDVLLYHVLGSIVDSIHLSDGLSIETLQGDYVTVAIVGGVMINEANQTLQSNSCNISDQN